MVVSRVINAPVLVLNQNYQPLNVCNVKRAFVLLARGKAELLVNGRGNISTVSSSFTIPSVIRLIYAVKRPLMKRRLSRRAIFYRDNFMCQYCGKSTKTLTLDHIIPRSRSGPHIWENVVSACIPCNHKKAGLTPKEANMKLLREPKAPRPSPYYPFQHRQIMEEWKQFMPWVE
ncbi:MAG: HNH endonuclease [Chloroflexi bacterium]|nr:HNH endonuclease [Chloroflexota bacterium]